MQVGERIRVILDCEDNTLAFEKNYEFLGKGQAECVNIDYTLNVIHILCHISMKFNSPILTQTSGLALSSKSNK